MLQIELAVTYVPPYTRQTKAKVGLEMNFRGDDRRDLTSRKAIENRFFDLSAAFSVTT